MANGKHVVVRIYEDGHVRIEQDNGTALAPEPDPITKTAFLSKRDVCREGASNEIVYCCSGNPICVWHNGQLYCF